MEVTLQYFDDCPSWRITGQRLRAALASAGHSEPISYVRVETDEDAERLQFHGSPTILVDGRDPFETSGLTVGLSCRVYRTPAGLAGSPTYEQIVAVIG
ncbi:MAG TPA: thioredoxin family protein [Propionibacteriaceae bacterium]|nr:thioredoxin family protein [Propionibacteriaceae bacterium]